MGAWLNLSLWHCLYWKQRCGVLAQKQSKKKTKGYFYLGFQGTVSLSYALRLADTKQLPFTVKTFCNGTYILSQQQ